MAYTKTTWAAGDTVTSQKLNKIENQLETLSHGGGAGCFVVNITPTAIGVIDDDTTKGGATKGVVSSGTINDSTIYITDKTYNEIVTAFQSGSLPIGVLHTEGNNSGGTRGASTGTSEEWRHLLFIYAAFDADYNEYIVDFLSIPSQMTFYATGPDSILTTVQSGNGPMPVS